MNDIKYSLLVCDYLVPKYAIATVISKALHFTVGRISTQYFFVEVRSWNLDIILSNIICQLHAKLNFGIFCYSLKMFGIFCLKAVFLIAIALKTKTNWSRIGGSRWLKLNFSNFISKISPQCDLRAPQNWFWNVWNQKIGEIRAVIYVPGGVVSTFSSIKA